MSLTGYVVLGTGVSGGAVVQPPSGAGYAPQFVNYNLFTGGVSLNGISCIFGPVLAPGWGTLTAFGVTDMDGNPITTGTLQAPFTPLIGQLVTVPQGNLSIVVGSQFNLAPMASVAAIPVQLSGPTVSGSVAIVSGAYTQVLASGARAALSLTNADQVNTVRIVLGGSGAPASGALGYSLIPPFGNWPPPGFGDFVPTDAIWAIGSAASQILNYLTAAPSSSGGTAVTALPVPPRGPTASGSLALASGSYTLVLASGARNMLLLTNADQTNTIRIVLGGSGAPASGALGYSLIPPFGSWPPPSMGEFIPDDAIWAIGTATGQILNYQVG